LKKFWKIAGILTVGVLVLGLALAVLAKTLITPARVKDRLLPLAEKTLQRRILLGDAEVGLFSGIVLKDLRILEKTGETPFLTADQIVLRYRLWPLLFKRVVVDEIDLVAPRITLIRQADGSFNCSDLLPRDPSSGNDPDRNVPAGDAGNPAPINLLIVKLGIHGGEIQFIDHRLNPESPFTYKISGLLIESDEISTSRAFPFTVQAQLAGTPLDFTGEAKLNPLSGQIRMHLGELDLVPFSPYFRQHLPGKLGALKLALDLTVAGDGQALTSSGRISLPAIDIVLNDWPEAPVRDAHVTLDYDFKADPAHKVVHLARADADLNGIRLNFSGTIENYVAAPRLDLLLVLPELDLRATLAALPKEMIKPVTELDPAGRITARFNLHGSPDQPHLLARQGELQLADVQFSAGGLRPSLSGLVTLEGDRAAGENLKLVLGDNTAAVSFKAGSLFARPLTFSSTISSEQFILDPLLKASAAPGIALNETSAPVNKTEIGPFNLPITADGEARIAQTVYRGLAIRNFSLRYRLLDNLLTVENLTGQVAGGSFQKTATCDLGKKGLAYQGQLDLKNIPADSLMKTFAPKAAGTVFGNFSMRADFSGKGTLPEAIRRNLSGQGEFSIADGRLTALPLMQGLADFVRLEELRDFSFQRAAGNYRLQKGKVSLHGDVSGRDVTMAPTGTIGLDGQLDLKLGTRLSPGLTAKLDRKGEISQFFTDSEGWGELPLLVAGSLDEPRFAFDPAAVKARAKDHLQRKLEEKVFKKLDSSETKSTGSTEQLLKDAFKGLFDK
jgi:AsmA protein